MKNIKRILFVKYFYRGLKLRKLCFIYLKGSLFNRIYFICIQDNSWISDIIQFSFLAFQPFSLFRPPHSNTCSLNETCAFVRLLWLWQAIWNFLNLTEFIYNIKKWYFSKMMITKLKAVSLFASRHQLVLTQSYLKDSNLVNAHFRNKCNEISK